VTENGMFSFFYTIVVAIVCGGGGGGCSSSCCCEGGVVPKQNLFFLHFSVSIQVDANISSLEQS